MINIFFLFLININQYNFNLQNTNKSDYFNHLNNIIVSLTSFPARMTTLHLVIESIIKQSIKPNKILLWLYEKEFPQKEKNIPKKVLNFQSHGLLIKYYPTNLKSHLKLIPTLKQYPNSIIITIDDDVYYKKDMIEKLYKSYLKNPKDIHAHRISKIIFNKIKKNFDIINGGLDYYNVSTYLNILNGVGGVIYPPNCFNNDIFNETLILKLAKTNDDLWFWVQAVLKGTKIKVVEKGYPQLKNIKGSQKITLGQFNNRGPKLFYKDLKKIFDYYKNLNNILINETFIIKNKIKKNKKKIDL